MFENTKSINGNKHFKIYGKQQQIKLLDIILEGLCTKELSPEGRQYLNRLRENLKYEIELLNNLSGSDSRALT
nr:hypothetical protein [Bacteroidota bacterium]